jgi:hypothetical protein
VVFDVQAHLDQLLAAKNENAKRLALVGLDVHLLVPTGAGDLSEPARIIPVRL